MHGNLEMVKTSQTSAIAENTNNHWSGRFSVAPMLDGIYSLYKSTN
ncbi:tRNA-dihydrouridine synthase [Salmonella enterica]|nr:tRNA-dihydrouridine synthase [Salmonella enterica]EDJ1071933.1 tRNA-dihydrouridine synthase [Salmonella enterica]EEG6732910.1 tRNA-dihydrouridine synthase [Salmonella enterica]